MSADYWISSQRAHWQFTSEQLNTSRFNIMMWEKQRLGNSPVIIRYDTNMRIFIHQMIARLGRRLSLRQIILSTAEIYISRFLTKVSLLEINIYMLVATSVYVSCKICESPQHIRTILAESRNCWPEFISGDFTKLAEFEFYLIEELECYLIVHHPYNSLIQLVEVLGKSNNNNDNVDNNNSNSIGKLNDNRNSKYKLNLTDNEIESVWQVINDSYMTDLPLKYPPHIISIAALHVVLILSIENNETNCDNVVVDKKKLTKDSLSNNKNTNATTTTTTTTTNNNNNNNKNNNGSDQLLGFVLESNNKNINSLSEDIVGRNNNNNINESRQMISNKGINTKNANNNNNTNNKSVTTNTNNKNSNGRNSVTMGFNTNNMNMNMNHGQGGVGGGGLRRKLSQSFSHQNRAISRTGNNSNNNITMSLSPEKSGFFNISMMLKSNNTHNYRNNSRIEEFTNFLASSNVNLVEVIESVQELLNLYEAWQLYDEGSVRQNVKTVLMALHTRTGGGVGVTGSSVMSV